MEPLDTFVIPVTTLRMGRNELNFTADWRFFERFESSPVQQGKFGIDLIFDRFQDHWHLVFVIGGAVDTECDRCLAPISLRVQGSHELYVKFDHDESQEADVINISRETTQFDISQFVYEFIVLSVPMIKRYNCESEKPRPCDMSMLAKLAGHEDVKEEVGPWETLKQIRIGDEESK